MEFISTEAAPAAIGPYSQAVRTENLLFCSGQIAIDPHSGQLSGDDVGSQSQRVFASLTAILKAAGASLQDVVKTTVYLRSMEDFAAMNAVYTQAFGDHRPARATVAVAHLPKGALVEIDCIAVCGDGDHD